MRIRYVPSKDQRKHVSDYNNFIADNFPELLVEQNPELILVTGGDGSMLHALTNSISKSYKVPILGRGAGTLNFIMSDFSIYDEFQLINDILNDKITLDILELSSIGIQFPGSENIYSAVNDIVVGQNLNHYYHFEITSEDKYYSNFAFKGAGFCLSTPLGSTGFNANNNGQLLRFQKPTGEASDLWSLTNIVSNATINDVLYEQEIVVKYLTDRYDCKVFLDGTTFIKTIKYGEEIRISKGETYRIAFLSLEKMFQKRIEMSILKRK